MKKLARIVFLNVIGKGGFGKRFFKDIYGNKNCDEVM